MVTKFGYKMAGLKKAATATGNGDPFTLPRLYTTIYYNVKTGEIIVYADHLNNSYMNYHDPDIIPIVTAGHHLTMNQIAAYIATTMDRRKRAAAR